MYITKTQSYKDVPFKQARPSFICHKDALINARPNL